MNVSIYIVAVKSKIEKRTIILIESRWVSDCVIPQILEYILTILAVVGSFRVIAMSPDNGLATLSQEIKNRLSKLGERDLSREYLQNCIAKISKSLPAYQEHRITIADLLDFEHEDRIIPVYILEQIYSHKDEYLPSEDFYRNMQRILRTDDRFVFTKDTAKEILERYLVMDREGTFATLLYKAIEFFETRCSGKSQGSE